MISYTIRGLKYIYQYELCGHGNLFLVHEKENGELDWQDKIRVDRFNRTLSYLVRSSQISEAIQEWEKRHNTKLYPR